MQPGKAVGNDMSGRVKQSQRDAAGAIERGWRQVSDDAGRLSENYNTNVLAGKISPNHGGNRAVWDTVGANSVAPEIGNPPKREPNAEWHFEKNGVPIAGPEPKAADATSPPKIGGKTPR